MSENKTQIPHFSHEHPLSLTPKSSSPTWCLVCWQDTAATMYSCTNKYCTEEFSIHRSCAELARELKHPFHPQHSLTLLAKPPYESGFFTCGACGRKSWAYSFHCSMCQFDLDVVCASLTPAKRQAPAQIQQHVLRHPHSLIPCQNEMKYELHCSGCKLPLKEGCWIYVCLHCRCLLDESCAEWPSQIQHNLHPQHLLTLLAPVPPPVDWDWDSFPRCRACGKVLEGFTFHCSECEFDLDACCARLVPKLKNDQGNERFQIQQLSHPHPLILCVYSRGSQLACDACQCQFEDSSLIAVCLVCNYLLHESCAQLPREVKHPVYHQHVLTLLEYSLRQSEEPFEWKKLVQSARHPSNLRRDAYMTGEMSKSRNHRGLTNKFNGQFHCQACFRYTKGFAYVCPKCTFYLDIKCPSSIPLLIEFKELHQQHPLAFFGLKPTYQYCDSCQQPIDTSFFRCLECNFNLHVRCVPTLPAAKDTHHRHLLTLTDSPIRDHPDEDENAEFYCDSCEQNRELYERTYYCQECHYVAHVHCVIYEALRVLVKDPSLAITSVFEENPGKGENAEWPSQIEESPFHPQHPLTLLFLPPRNSRGCAACGKELQGITYHCSQCTFSLDLFCASLEPTKDTEFGRLSRHPHPLIFCKKEMNFRLVLCCGCKRPIQGPWICVCLHCNGFLDESCIELPSQMEHPFHPQHPLTLLFQPPCDLKGCRACGKELLSFCFHCSECKFTLDPFCASLKPAQPLGLTLSHPLTLCEQQNYKEFTFSCYACRGDFKGSVYICLESCFLLHIYCANLPSKIDSKFCHPHPLTLLESPRDSEKTFEFNGLFQCHTCKTDTVGFAYACRQCIIYSDIKCTIRSALHEHPLNLYNVSGRAKCNACHKLVNTPFFYCKDCKFCLHVACFPILPQIVKHVAHRHPLALTHPPIEHDPARDRWNSEFYCDACSCQELDYFAHADKPAYSCQECNFVAHVHCVAAQEPSKLEKEWTLALRLYEENSVKDENRIHVPEKKRKENPETMSVEDLEGLIADAAAEREASHQKASKTRGSRTNIDINYRVRELGEKIAKLSEMEKLLARELRATTSEKMQLEEELRRMLDISNS